MDQDTIIKFIKKNDMLKVSQIEKKAGIPSRSLHKALNDQGGLKQEYIEKLTEVLIPFGLEDSNSTKVYSIINNKGGVAKTTTACNLGAALEILGYKVLLIDLDPQGNLSQHLGYDNPIKEIVDILLDDTDWKDVVLHYHDNLHILPSTIKLDKANITLQSNPMEGFHAVKEVINKIGSEYDYILIDCPPNMSILNSSALVASTKLIVPLEAGTFALRGLDNIFDLMTNMKKLNKKLELLGFLFTRIKDSNIIRSHIKSLRSSNYHVFETEIRENVELQEAPTMGQDVFSYSPKSKGAVYYMDFAKEIIEME